MLQRLVWGLVITAGLAAVAVCAYWVLADWLALEKAYGEYRQQVQAGAPLRALFNADSFQDIHRTNCFAAGVGVLLSAILVAIGLLGWCQTFQRARNTP